MTLMFGRRPEGRRVKDVDPIVAITPYLMPQRVDAQVFLDFELEYEPLVRYIAEKSNEGQKLTFMEIVMAAYVRTISQLPEINRFVHNKQYYDRTELTISLTLLMNTSDGSIEENCVKMRFDPSDTIFDVRDRVVDYVEKARQPEDPGFALKLAKGALAVPGLATVLAGLVKLLDRYGLCPKALLDELPFHTSLYLTNMASIAMPRVYHHIYNFGNTTMFVSIGVPNRKVVLDRTGKPVRKRMLPVGITADERVCAGAVYAKFWAAIQNYLTHPELLETPPEKVLYAPGCEYHVPKVQKA